MVYLYKYKIGPKEKKDSLKFLEDALKRYCPSEDCGIKVFKDEQGRPLTDKEGVFVSASHTGDIVVCAVSESPVGIDAQIVKSDLKTERIAGRFFTDEEQGKILEEGTDAFYEIWCRKEAFSKVIGKGISYGLKNIATVKKDGAYAEDIDGFRMMGIRIPEGYFACAGGEGDLLWIEIQE